MGINVHREGVLAALDAVMPTLCRTAALDLEEQVVGIMAAIEDGRADYASMLGKIEGFQRYPALHQALQEWVGTLLKSAI